MSADPPSRTSADPAEQRIVPLRHSLMPRVAAVLVGFVALVSAALFFGIDHFVSGEFRQLHRERIERIAGQVRGMLERELRSLESTAALLANDADLNNSTYYHLYLDGEKEHPQAAVRRIAQAFQLRAVVLRDATGRVIVASVDASAGAPPDLPVRSPGAGARAEVAWAGDTPWVLASVVLTHAGNVLAWLQLGRPVEDVYANALGADEEVSVRLAGRDPPAADALRLSLATGDPPLAIDVAAPDTVGAALAVVKRLLAAILVVSGVLLAAGLGLFLRWQLRPLLDLTRAAAAIGRGELRQRLPARGRNEIARLVEAFNNMSEGLARTRELEQQLQHRERLSAIGRVAARVAHDLNNPLTVISNAATLAQRGLGHGDPLAGDLQLIRHHCERCLRTVQNLLSYGRPLKLRTARLDLSEACREIVERWRARRHPDARLRFAPAVEPLAVDADQYQLEQLLDNLLTNALDAAPGGEILVATGAAGDRAYVRVVDGGPGFSADARRHLFEPFFTTKTGGTGLGLASCLAIARAHGGDIEIGAPPGAALTVWLPRAAAAPVLAVS